jgi:PKHD-type hydroxylase
MHTHVISGVLEPAELDRVRALILRSRFVDGNASARGAAQSVKANEQLACSTEDSRALAEIVFGALRRHPEFGRKVLPLELSAPMINRYAPGMSYGGHFDRAFMATSDGRQIRTDLSGTLFLSPPQDYDGGELCISRSGRDDAIKLAAGDLFLYPSCALHSVSPVTRGERHAVVFWVQSMIRDHEQRGLVADLDAVIGSLVKSRPGCNEVRDLSAIVNSLTRIWGELRG